MNAPELAVVMPVYNESSIIPTVVDDWCSTLDALGVDYQLHLYDDGSRDGTGAILAGLTGAYPRLRAHAQANMGHGPTIVKGYRENCGAQWVFQVDSDNELSPADFPAMWRMRDTCDVILGSRHDRQSPAVRRVISLTARLVVKMLFGSDVPDANVPFRLMRASVLRPMLDKIPADTLTPNLFLSGLAGKPGVRLAVVPVSYTPRATGEVSIRHFKLLRFCLKAFRQTLAFRLGSLGGA